MWDRLEDILMWVYDEFLLLLYLYDFYDHFPGFHVCNLRDCSMSSMKRFFGKRGLILGKNVFFFQIDFFIN